MSVLVELNVKYNRFFSKAVSALTKRKEQILTIKKKLKKGTEKVYEI